MSERTSWAWQHAVREHDGKITVRSGAKDARAAAEYINRTVAELRIDVPPAVVVRRKVTTTIVTKVTRGAWEADR